MTAHTKGPWHSAAKSAKSWHVGVYTEQGDEVAHIAVKSALHGKRRDADARLIAAAPDLLDAAQKLAALDFGVNGWSGALESAARELREAIKKATGEQA